MDNILKEQLSEDLQTNESLGKFNDANGLAKSYVELENKFGSIKEEHETKLSELQGKLDKAIQIPGKDADDNTRKQFYQKLGCPEKPENYSAIEIEGIPEGFEKDEEITTKIRHACCEAGISDNQYKAVMTQLVKEQLVSLDNFVKQDKQAEEEAVATLTQKWGGDAKYKEKVELARRLVEHYNPEDKAVSEFLENTRLGSYAPLVELLGNVAADIIAEETTFIGTGSSKKKESEVEISPTTGEPVLRYDKSPELYE